MTAPRVSETATFPLAMRVADLTETEDRDAGRILTGICVPYGEPSYFAGERVETFRRGCFRKHLQERKGPLKLFRNHDHGAAIGKATSWDEDHRDGFVATFRVFDTPDGNAALTEIHEGALDSLSVGFRAIQARPSMDGRAVEIVEAALGEVSLVALPAYSGAQILAVRHRDEIRDLFGPAPVVNLTPVILRHYDSAIPVAQPGRAHHAHQR